MNKKNSFLIVVVSLIFCSCSSLTLENVKYGWGGEVFVNPDENGMVSIPKSSMQFNVMPILTEENLTQKPKEIKFRIIRDDEGYFYLTANKFKNIWVFISEESSLALEKKIDLLEGKALDDPKFNEQKPYVKLFLKDGKEFILNKKGQVKLEDDKK